MGKGRRFSFFWISIFTIAGSGCAGCGDCFGRNDGCSYGDSGDDSGCGNGASFCDSQTCSAVHPNGTAACSIETDECELTCSVGYANCNHDVIDGCEANINTDPQHCGDCFIQCAGACVQGICQPNSNVPIIDGLVAPTGLATDGVEVFYVDQGTLTVFDPATGLSNVLASGVLPNGGIITDGTYVYWGGQWLAGIDAGVVDAGDDSGDASDDASADSGEAVGAILSGIFRVNVTTGVVELVAPLDVFSGVALDLQGFGNVFARQQIDLDAGTSMLGFASPDGGAFSPLASLSGNAGNMHAIAPGVFDVVALDNSDIVSIALDGGGKSVVVADAGALSLLPTTTGQLDIVQTDGSFTVRGVAAGSLAANATPGVAGEVATSGTFAYVVNQTRGEIDQYSGAELPLVPIAVATQISGTVSFLAADRNYVYWIVGSAVFQAPVPP